LELNDIIPYAVRILGTPKDRFYSISQDRYDDLVSLNKAYVDTIIDLFDEDLIKRIIFEIQQRKNLIVQYIYKIISGFVYGSTIPV